MPQQAAVNYCVINTGPLILVATVCELIPTRESDGVAQLGVRTYAHIYVYTCMFTNKCWLWVWVSLCGGQDRR